ncbi:MAG: phosphate ABC transporter substrate-binding protein, partial [Enterococcus sp.]
IDGIQPTDENVSTNRWKIWAYEHMYTKGEPTELVKDFLEYMLSDSVQEKIVPQLGYISISEMKVERDWQGNQIN